MRSGSNIRALLIFFPVLVAVIFVGGFATSDAQEGAPLPVVQQQSLLPDDGLPSNPQDWICPDSMPVNQQEIDAWCKLHPKGTRGLGLPEDLRNPPPISDFKDYMDYSDRLRKFLSLPDQNMEFEYMKLGWISDAHWRLSGPSVMPDPAHPSALDLFHNYGPHFPLKIYYSPEMVDWLCSGRKGEIPDGAAMVKAMNVFKNIKIVQKDDGCMNVDPSMPVVPNLWTPMIKSSRSSYDGWLWMIQQAPGNAPQFPPPLFGLSAFTVDPDDPTADDPDWYPTGGLQELMGFGKKA